VVVGELSAEDEEVTMAFVREKGEVELPQAFIVLSEGRCIKVET
jgi:hypothetical protein